MKCSIVLLTRGHEYVEICSNSMLYKLQSFGRNSEYQALVESELDFHEGNIFRRLFLSGYVNEAIIPKAVALLVSDESGNIVGLFRSCVRGNVLSVYYFDYRDDNFWRYITGEDTIIRDTGIIKTNTGFRFTRGHLMLFPIFVSARNDDDCLIDTALVLVNLKTRKMTVLSNLRNEANTLKVLSKLKHIETKIINAYFRYENSLCIVVSDSCFLEKPSYMYPDSGHLGVGIIASVGVQLKSFALDSFEVGHYLRKGFILCESCSSKPDLVIPDFDFPLSLSLSDSTNLARVFINRASELGVIYASFVQSEIKLFLASDSQCSLMLDAQHTRDFNMDFIRRDKSLLFENWNIEEPIIPKADSNVLYRRLISISMMNRLSLDVNGDIRCMELCQVKFIVGAIRGTVGYFRSASCDLDMNFSETRFGEFYLYACVLRSLKNLQVVHNLILQKCILLSNQEDECTIDLKSSRYNVINLSSIKGHLVLTSSGARVKTLVKASANTIMSGEFMVENIRFTEGTNAFSAFTLIKPCSISADIQLVGVPRLTIKGLAKSQFGDYGLSLVTSSQIYHSLIDLVGKTQDDFWVLDLLDTIPDEKGHITVRVDLVGSASYTDCESARVMAILSLLCLLSTMKLKVKSGITVSFALSFPLSLLSELSEDSDCTSVYSVRSNPVNTVQSETDIDLRADNALDALFSTAGAVPDCSYLMLSLYMSCNTTAASVKRLLTKCADNLDANGMLPRIHCIYNSKRLQFSDEMYNFYTNVPTQYCLD